MITAHVNHMGIVLRFDSSADNLSREEWEALLAELKSVKRSRVDVSPEFKTRVVIDFTPDTVTIDEAIPVLKKRNIVVKDIRDEPANL